MTKQKSVMEQWMEQETLFFTKPANRIETYNDIIEQLEPLLDIPGMSVQIRTEINRLKKLIKYIHDKQNHD